MNSMGQSWQIFISYLVKLIVISLLILVERVVGWPVLSAYLVWRLGTGAPVAWQWLSFGLASLLIGGLYGVSSAGVLILLMTGFWLLKIKTLNQQRLIRVLVLSAWLVLGMIILGVAADQRALIYLVVQVLILVLVQIPLSRRRPKLRLGTRVY